MEYTFINSIPYFTHFAIEYTKGNFTIKSDTILTIL